jgi:hypothetical protein
MRSFGQYRLARLLTTTAAVTGSASRTPLVDRARTYWYPRLRGGVLVLLGTLAYAAFAAAFGDSPSFVTALIGMCGSLAAMAWVWWLESRRAAKDDAAHANAQRDAGTT